MDNFSFCFNLVCLIAQSGLHIYFSESLNGKKRKAGHYITYMLLFCFLDWFASRLSFPWVVVIGMGLLLLYGVNRCVIGSSRPASWITAVLAVYISQLSFGVVNSAEAMLLPDMVGTPFLYVLVIAAAAVSFAVCFVCYTVVVRSVPPEEIGQMENAGCLLVPALFFFAAELYIMQTSYTQTFSGTFSLENMGRHTALLFLQILGLGALFCTLYAYRHLCRSLRVQAEMQLLTQAARMQKQYVSEAKARYEQTRAFRHDIKNHLTVLDGLLQRGKQEESRAWLKKLEAVSEKLSFPCQTGNPVMDILLGEKLELAEGNGIAVEVSLVLPQPCGIDDFDLCVIAANAMDNAIEACRLVPGGRTVRVRGERQGDFYMLAFENTCPDQPLPPPGTGLSNIRAVAEKYHGAMLTEKKGRNFSLHVLLNIS